ncbi:hypothetical protein BJY01DRAFT_102598 [Aspergillus pseudoustus]|uniref:Nucleoside phosphorylase domain-containing protein n=1 Tax=Aspergillus pseudoustus TaxID=1810923 RepID=A0ABR4IY70_9EURO
MPTPQTGDRPRRPATRSGFEIVVICALTLEADAIEAALDVIWDDDDDDDAGPPLLKAPNDPNTYYTGAIGCHNIVLAHMPGMGKVSAALVATNCRLSFPNIRLALVVGVCGVVPYAPGGGEEILLGDVIISTGVVQHDIGRRLPDGFHRKDTLLDTLGRPNIEIRGLLAKMQGIRGRRQLGAALSTCLDDLQTEPLLSARYPGADYDVLFEETGIPVQRKRRTSTDRPTVHFGLVASGDTVFKCGADRDRLAATEGVIAFEMESAGVWDVFPCVVIKGACDYADSHKSKIWQRYAAATAAACMKAFLGQWRPAVPAGLNPVHPTGPFFIVPYPKNKAFVGRHSLLDKLRETVLVSSPPRLAIFGLGGIGKTQIAIEYAYWIQENCPDTSVFWVSGGTEERFRDGYARIAEECHIPGIQHPEADLLHLVQTWLERNHPRRWLMILDGADDAQMLYPSHGNLTTLDAPCHDDGGGGHGLATYLPESPLGSLLVTTRNKQVAVLLTNNQSILEVGRMKETEARQLLRTTLDGLEQEDETAAKATDNQQGSTLAARLEYLPLALVQAAAYIQMNSMSVDRYLELLDSSDDSLVELLNKNFDAVGRDPDTPHAVAATWILSFQKIELQSPLAGELLSLLCFFDRQAIPMEFVYHHCQQQQQHRGYRGAIQVEEALGLLKAFSFIAAEKDPDRIAIHRLVQLVTRRWLAHRGTAARFAQLALQTVSNLYPYGSYETRVLCSAYLPHAFAVLRFVEEGYAPSNPPRSGIGPWLVERFTVATASIASLSIRLPSFISQGLEKTLGQTWAVVPRQWLDESSTAQSTLCHNVAGFCLYQGRFEDAEALQLKAVRLRRERLGEESPFTLDSKSNLASTYARQGRWGEAAALLTQLIAVEQRVLGAEDLSTLTSMANLASAYWHLGQWSMAEELNMQVVGVRKRVLGEEHPETLIDLANLASIYWDQGRCGEAEALEVQVMERRRRILGEEHPSTLTSMANLASTYSSQGRYEGAEALEVRVVEIRKKVLGAEHPDTLTSMANLASTYSDQERWKEAEELEAQVLDTRKKTLGDRHPSTLTSMANLASTYWEQGWWEAAEQLEKYVVKTRKLVLGKIHPDTLTSMANLSQTWRSQGRFEEATDLMRECFVLREQRLGADHADTKSCLANLSDWQEDSNGAAQDLTDS